MKISVAGLSHQTAPVDVRERYAVPAARMTEFLQSAMAVPGIEEVVLLSTCNRVEIYAAGAADATEAMRALFERDSGAASGDWLFSVQQNQAAEHLFRVSCGLESMVIGETEILGQVKQAYATAAENQATGPILNRLFQRAFRAAKQARSTTGITRGSVSVGSVAVDLAERIFGDLRSCRVMILGAGDTSERTARALLSRGARSMIVSNRSADRAAALAIELGGEAVSFDDWMARLPDIDILVSSTAAPHPIVEADALAGRMRSRMNKPLFIIDLAVPRDVDPAANDIEGVYLYDIDSLQDIAAETMQLRRNEISACAGIIGEHTSDFMDWLSRRGNVADENCANGAHDSKTSGSELTRA
jgi:glutamyl-tRNA reductase